MKSTTKKGFGFVDLILILQAKKNNCDFFVTKDNQLRDIIIKDHNLKIMGLKEFLGKLR